MCGGCACGSPDPSDPPNDQDEGRVCAGCVGSGVRGRDGTWVGSGCLKDQPLEGGGCGVSGPLGGSSGTMLAIGISDVVGGLTKVAGAGGSGGTGAGARGFWSGFSEEE